MSSFYTSSPNVASSQTTDHSSTHHSSERDHTTTNTQTDNVERNTSSSPTEDFSFPVATRMESQVSESSETDEMDVVRDQHSRIMEKLRTFETDSSQQCVTVSLEEPLTDQMQEELSRAGYNYHTYSHYSMNNGEERITNEVTISRPGVDLSRHLNTRVSNYLRDRDNNVRRQLLDDMDQMRRSMRRSLRTTPMRYPWYSPLSLYNTSYSPFSSLMDW